jgi:hypothetical protein
MKKLKRNPNAIESNCYKSSDDLADLNNDESQQQNDNSSDDEDGENTLVNMRSNTSRDSVDF